MKKLMSNEELSNKIINYNVVTFDIFDTLIKRDCQSPNMIFKEVEYRYKQLHKRTLDFSTLRYNAELDLYKQGNITPTIEEIYDIIPLNKSVKDELMNLEIDTEIQLSCANKPLFDLYLDCLKQGKCVYAISDMYLPHRVLQSILKKCNYIVSNIWVSSDKRANKSSGALFEVFLRETGIKRAEVLHIGDNYKADIKGASKAGIKAVQIPAHMKNTTYYNTKKNNKESWENMFLYPFVNNHINFISKRSSQIGFETLGPTVYGFCLWLNSMKKKYNFEKLLFCARDVLQTMEIYNTLFPDDEKNTVYLCVSLKSLKKPYEAALGIDKSQEALHQLHLIKRYLKQLGCTGKVAMVDSGCGGHTQHMLEVILGKTCDFHGLYMRISKNFHKNIDDKESFPYMFNKRPSARSFISGALFETLLSASHGRTLGYEENSDGNVVPIWGESNPQKDLLTEFQEGIRYFATVWKNNINSKRNINSTYIENSFLNFSFFPTKSDVNIMSQITGGNETYMGIVLDKDKSILLNLRDTYWKGGYLCNTFKYYKGICHIYLLLDVIILNIMGF